MSGPLENATTEPDRGCPFCGHRNLVIVSESTRFFVVYNRYSIVRGHCLITPKRHVVSFLSLSDIEASELVVLSRRVISALLRAYDTSSFDYALQEGVPAGGTIAHLHFHVIPRTGGDLEKPDDWYPELLKRQFYPAHYDQAGLNEDDMVREARRIATYFEQNND